MQQSKRLAAYAWAVLGYNILIILWGAFVRASSSGAGCGRHWPLCEGQVIPRPEQLATLVEFTHRATSGLAGLAVLVLLIWVFRAYPRRHLVRRAAAFSLLFILFEALIGAGLVLFEWVDQDASPERAIAVAVHLTNTFLLLASLTLTAWWATTTSRDRPAQLRWQRDERTAVLLGIGLLAMLVVSSTGALTALADTLFPAESVREGLLQDFSATAHFLVRLRVWHPLIAILSGIYLFLVASLIRGRAYASTVHGFARAVQLLFVVQLFAGLLNVLLLTPVWLQLLHLLLADTIWVALVLLAVTALTRTEYATEPAAVLPAEPLPMRVAQGDQ